MEYMPIHLHRSSRAGNASTREVRREGERMFGHHRDAVTMPDVPEKQIGEGRFHEELDAELEALESETEDVNE